MHCTIKVADSKVKLSIEKFMSLDRLLHVICTIDLSTFFDANVLGKFLNITIKSALILDLDPIYLLSKADFTKIPIVSLLASYPYLRSMRMKPGEVGAVYRIASIALSTSIRSNTGDIRESENNGDNRGSMIDVRHIDGFNIGISE